MGVGGGGVKNLGLHTENVRQRGCRRIRRHSFPSMRPCGHAAGRWRRSAHACPAQRRGAYSKGPMRAVRCGSSLVSCTPKQPSVRTAYLRSTLDGCWRRRSVQASKETKQGAQQLGQRSASSRLTMPNRPDACGMITCGRLHAAVYMQPFTCCSCRVHTLMSQCTSLRLCMWRSAITTSSSVA